MKFIIALFAMVLFTACSKKEEPKPVEPSPTPVVSQPSPSPSPAPEAAKAVKKSEPSKVEKKK